MYCFTRTKKVTDPLGEKVKARIIGWDRVEPDYVSSGSEHSIQADDDVTELFFNFIDQSPEKNDSDCEPEPDSSPSISDSRFRNNDLIRPIVINDDPSDLFRKLLKDHVFKALQAFFSSKPDRQVVRRSVMAYLRNYGYNAAVCKTKWQSSCGVTAGSHEFVDVIAKDPAGTRYFVDLDFASEFEIARPTDSYESLRRLLPAIFVGKIEDLKRILKAVSDAARRSMRSGGLHLLPWRKYRFMEKKWLGPYRRTINILPASFCPVVSSYGDVECRAVGFDSGMNGCCLVLPMAARTR
ncbi:hypothetical protein CASFOL_040302 [Castilleja foliolosa]|uniref:Uncharacterized protein n=1 Tax=Castilleja foliolosa TaxID=1961234 RepID=A0ABD3BFK4_9LAMI